MDLSRIFFEINLTYFANSLEVPVLKWNSRLRSCAGRFTPGSRRFFIERRPVIEVASYLRELEEAEKHIWDTLAHEMIHYWLWLRRRPYGHTREFLAKMRSMGVSRYNPVPKERPFKYIYFCAKCLKEFRVRRKLNAHACRDCCKKHSRGKYHSEFRLVLRSRL